MSFEVVDGQAMLIDPEGVELITLNEVGTCVWEELDGRRGSAELAHDLLPRFEGVSRAELERDIGVFLDQLGEAGLLDDETDV